jgi:glycosyltransferase 2 family protein
MSRFRWLLTALSFAAAIGASLYIVVTTWPAGGAAALPWAAHAAALAAALMEVAMRGLKLRFSARALGVPLSFGGGLRTCLGGDFASSITPARSGSEPARFLVLSEAGVAPAPAILLLFTELVLEMLSLALVTTALALLFRDAGRAIGGLVGLVGGYAAFVIGAGVAGLVLARRRSGGPPPAWARRVGLDAARWRAVQRALRQLRVGVGAVRQADAGAMLLAYVASLGHVAMRLLVLPALVVGADPTVRLAPLVVWPLALFYGSVVAPAPGGGGVVEVAFRATLGDAIPPALFAASLIWWRFYTFYIYILLGALAAGRTVVRALRGERGEGRGAGRRAA